MARRSFSDSESESPKARPQLPGSAESLSPAAFARFDEALESCRVTLRRPSLTDPRESWHEAIAVLCSVARTEGVSPESFLVHFKGVLDDIEGFQAVLGETSETSRSRIITLAIKCYFGSR